MSPRARVSGVDTAYVRVGKVGGVPVVFIHGYPFSKEMWAPQLEALAPVADCVAYDIRGFGESSHGSARLSIDLFVDDLIDLIDSLQLIMPVAVGLSMGGYIALRAYERFPARFRGLVLCDTRSDADGEEGRRRRQETMRGIEERGSEAFADDFLKRAFAASSLATSAAAVEHIRTTILRTAPEVLIEGQMALMRRHDTTPILPLIRIPVLVLVGEEDALTPPAVSRAMAEQITDSELHVIPGAGHLSNLENPPVFCAHLGTYLARL